MDLETWLDRWEEHVNSPPIEILLDKQSNTSLSVSKGDSVGLEITSDHPDRLYINVNGRHYSEDG